MSGGGPAALGSSERERTSACNDRVASAAGLNPAEPWLVGLSFGKFPAGGAGWLVSVATHCNDDNPLQR